MDKPEEVAAPEKSLPETHGTATTMSETEKSDLRVTYSRLATGRLEELASAPADLVPGAINLVHEELERRHQSEGPGSESNLSNERVDIAISPAPTASAKETRQQPWYNRLFGGILAIYGIALTINVIRLAFTEFRGLEKGLLIPELAIPSIGLLAFVIVKYVIAWCILFFVPAIVFGWLIKFLFGTSRLN